MYYSVVLESIGEPGFEGYYYAHIPALDLTTHGQGVEGALAAAKELAEAWIGEKRLHGEIVPEDSRFLVRSCLKIRSVGPACAAYGAAGRQRASEKVVGVAREAGESSGFVDAAQRRSTAFAAARSQDGVLRQLLTHVEVADAVLGP